MFSWLKNLLKGDPQKFRSNAVYSKIVSHARNPVFYQELAVPDTLDGRFDMILLHMYAFVARLETCDDMQDKKLAQMIQEALFDDMDRSLREMGVGDLSVGKHIKKMSSAWFGRKSAYEAALAKDTDEDLAEAISRNIYGQKRNHDCSIALAQYFRKLVDVLETADIDDVRRGNVCWPEPVI